MKDKMLKTGALLSAAVISTALLSSCAVVDDARRSQAFADNNYNTYTVDGTEYKHLMHETLVCLTDYRTGFCVYLTDDDVPTLLASRFCKDVGEFNRDRTVLWFGNDVTVREDKYDEMAQLLRSAVYDRFGADKYVENDDDAYQRKFCVMSAGLSNAISEALAGEPLEATYPLMEHAGYITEIYPCEESGTFRKAGNTDYYVTELTDGSWCIENATTKLYYKIDEEYLPELMSFVNREQPTGTYTPNDDEDVISPDVDYSIYCY